MSLHTAAAMFILATALIVSAASATAAVGRDTATVVDRYSDMDEGRGYYKKSPSASYYNKHNYNKKSKKDDYYYKKHNDKAGEWSDNE